MPEPARHGDETRKEKPATEQASYAAVTASPASPASPATDRRDYVDDHSRASAPRSKASSKAMPAAPPAREEETPSSKVDYRVNYRKCRDTIADWKHTTEELKQQVADLEADSKKQAARSKDNFQTFQQNERSLKETIERLERENAQLHKVHVKAVNMVAPGVEPVSDQVFVSRIDELQDRVGAFCRATFRGVKVVGQDDSTIDSMGVRLRMMAPRDIYCLSTGNAAEMLFWSHAEALFINRWLPGVNHEHTNMISLLSNDVVCSGQSRFHSLHTLNDTEFSHRYFRE